MRADDKVGIIKQREHMLDHLIGNEPGVEGLQELRPERFYIYLHTYNRTVITTEKMLTEEEDVGSDVFLCRQQEQHERAKQQQ